MCSVGVGMFTGLLAVFWSWVCWPVRGLPRRGWRGGGGGVQVAVYQGDGGGAFADGGGDPFDRSVARVTGGEHSGQAGFEWHWRAGGAPAVAVGGWQVSSGEDESLLVACDGAAEPLCAWLCADEGEQGVSGDGPLGAGGGVGQDQRVQVAGAGAGACGDLDAVADVDVGGGADLADEVVGHGVGQRIGAGQDCHLVRPFGQVQRGLPGGVAAAGDEHRPAGMAGASLTAAP